MIRERFAKHRGYVNTKNESKTIGAHFNTRGHSTSDMEITVLENIFKKRFAIGIFVSTSIYPVQPPVPSIELLNPKFLPLLSKLSILIKNLF